MWSHCWCLGLNPVSQSLLSVLVYLILIAMFGDSLWNDHYILDCALSIIKTVLCADYALKLTDVDYLLIMPHFLTTISFYQV